MRFGATCRALFALAPEAIYLNHGSFGAVPNAVRAVQDSWRDRIERQPSDFFWRHLQDGLEEARGRLQTFLGGAAGRLALVDNATTGINAVLRSIAWRPGDEIVTTDHAYGAVRRTLEFVADRWGVRVSVARLPVPATDPGVIVGAVADSINANTRLAVIDHVSSPSALVLPLAEIVALCRARGVPILVDGAHAPGMLPLDLGALGADWYAGNLHKWLFAPRGGAFLWSRADRADGLHPTVISHGYGQGLEAEFDWTGTKDYTPWLTIPAALDFAEAQDAAGARDYRRELILDWRQRLTAEWKTECAGPTEMSAAMVTVRMPIGGPANIGRARAIGAALWRHGRVEVPVLPLGDRLWVRLSAQIYNQDSDLDRLVSTFEALSGDL